MPGQAFPLRFRGVRAFGEAARTETIACVAFGGVGQFTGAETRVFTAFCERRQNRAS